MQSAAAVNVLGFTLQTGSDWFDSHIQERRPEEPADRKVDLTPRAGLWQGRCLIIRVPRDMPVGQPFADVFFIDVQRPQLFAMFSDMTPTLLPGAGGGTTTTTQTPAAQ
jgi:hypothetical protein